MAENRELQEEVRAHYAAVASAVAAGRSKRDALAAENHHGPRGSVDAAVLYSADEQAGLPVEAVEASMGTGNPTAVAELRPSERVLDLGSGGGMDALLAARRVGPNGFVYGIDMVDEMVALAEANKAKAGVTNVEFRKGAIEDVPMPDASVDVVISNCTINLSLNKPAVFAEMFRVLVPGGRIAISDTVAEDRLTPQDRAERGTHARCIAGTLSRQEYLDALAAAGFTDASVTFTRERVDGIHHAIIRATKPAAHPGG
ncbi:methyltransferase domain-containing protein [Mycobacterium sp. SM1]|uniref:methyltransferase domain-containing protein n=1 Tax=Mycobacterium sp. SM1 TaxID=2816243 RepID=UPI001F17BC98|nr:methyltransferase domain-containing protein [Mycobacterium sp. SM1]